MGKKATAMRRRREQRDHEPGYDSFLDIVTNIVGILIILVMVVGVRAKNSPVDVAPDRPETVDAETLRSLAARRTAVESLRADTLKLAEQIREVERERLFRQYERERLAVLDQALQEEIESRAEKLDDAQRQRRELEAAIAEHQRRMDRFLRERAAIDEMAQPVVLRHRATPLAKLVDEEDELHFRLLDGRLAFIPLEELIEELVSDAQGKLPQLLRNPEFSSTVGPIGGFRLRYTMQQKRAHPEDRWSAGRATGLAELKRWVLLPASEQLGEPVDEALKQGSQFRRRLAGYVPETTTVTIWLYPADFANFRRVRDQLYELGFATAGRPLPDGFPITGSPDGTKSAAE